MKNVKATKRKRRHNKVRSQISGTKEIPRLAVFKSNKHIYCQLIDDTNSKTLAAASDISIKKDKQKNTNVKEAEKLGAEIAKKAQDLKIDKVVFDRGGFKYHGLIKAVAEGARKAGLKF